MDDKQITEPAAETIIDPPTITNETVPIPEPSAETTYSETLDIPPSTIDPVAPTEPTPELIPEPPSIEPVVIPEPPQLSDIKPQPSVPISVPEPQLHPDPSTLTPIPQPLTVKPFDVSRLSDADLKAAAALYTKRNQAELSRKGVAKRQETMELNLREIVDFLSLNNGSPLPRIAKHTNITLGTTSKYLRQLNAKGKVRAEGWGKNRHYYLK
jgi:predicted transcriptional regulator